MWYDTWKQNVIPGKNSVYQHNYLKMFYVFKFKISLLCFTKNLNNFLNCSIFRKDCLILTVYIKVFVKICTRTGELTQPLRSLVPLAEDQVQFPEPTKWFTIIHNSSPRECDILFWPPRTSGTHVLHIYTCRWNTQCTYNLNKKNTCI